MTAKAVYDELCSRGIEVEVIRESPPSLMRYKLDDGWHLLHSSTPDSSSAVGKLVCDQKMLATAMAQRLSVPVPETERYSTWQQAEAFLQKYGRVVVKPVDAAHGHGVSVNIASAGALKKAIDIAREESLTDDALLQRCVTGVDLRILIIGGALAAAVKRVPAQVVGDGKHTLRELIVKENTENPDRGEPYKNKLAHISMSAAERFCGASLDQNVPAAGAIVQVVGAANIGTGGEAHDVTDDLRRPMLDNALAIAKELKVAVCGVDFMWDETSGDYFFIEANACPSFGLHMQPSVGQPRNVVKLFVDSLLASE